MRRPNLSKRLQIVSAVAAVIALAGAYLALSGSVILRDPRSEIASAHIIDGWDQRQELAVVGFAYFAVPKLEGTIEIKFVNGKVARNGYVTPGAPTWQTVGKEFYCSKA
jgi:hypothetical protein